MRTRKQTGCASLFIGVVLAWCGFRWIWQAWHPPWLEMPSDAEMMMGYAGCALVACGVVALVFGVIYRAAN